MILGDPGPCHLVAVWNPTYETDAMEAHVSVLLRNLREYRERRRDESDVYVWWGKVKSSNRQQPLPHLAEILALDDRIEREGDEGAELHLYLTDYRSLYVAHLAGVSAADMSEEDEFVPSYYREKGLSCDCWFQLWDIRRLVFDDTPMVVRELARLRNVRYHDRPVSLYGGMVELPLLVTRDDEPRFFDEDTRHKLADGRYWVEFDAERGGTGAIQRDLRENRFGNEAWTALEPAARVFIATGEQVFREHRWDAACDLSGAVVDLVKAMEVQVNALLAAALAGAPRGLRYLNVEGHTLDLSSGATLTIGQLARVIGGERALNEYLETRLVNGRWFASQLPPILEELRQVRNAASHGELVPRERLIRLRNQLIGVGCKGQLVDLALVKVRE